MFLEKSVQEGFRFLRGGKKNSTVTGIFCLLALSLVLSLTVLHGGELQPLKAVASSHVTVDFGSRQNTAHPIPSNLLGVAGIGMGTALLNDGNAVLQANFHLAKIGDYDFMSLVFPTAASATNASQQNWTKFDTEIGMAVSYHLQPLISLTYTPGWLQAQNQKPPLTNPCLTYNPPFDAYMVKPTYMVNGVNKGPQMWGKLAALFVAHMDQKFPQVHGMFEIWNQPDGSSFFCEPKGDANADQDRFNDYKALYAATAPQMRQQASKDGVQIKIGGPALVYAMQKHQSLWFPGLLNDPSIYPYVDFVTYHRFLRGTNFYGGSTSFVTNAQDPMFGVDAQYEQIAKIVHAGKQPNAARTPIYIDEYNMDTCVPQQCKNDPTYAPLTNALFLEDVLNSVNDTGSAYGPATSVPAGLAFYTWNIPSKFVCMFGILDANLDCATKNGTVQAYPQYYAYDLFGGANYLDMTNGGYVANSASANLGGLYVTGFYTKTLDDMVIVNATGTNYAALNVFAQNPGKVSGLQAHLYTVAFNRSNPTNSISTQQVNLVAGQNGYSATIHVPANTVVGFSIAS